MAHRNHPQTVERTRCARGRTGPNTPPRGRRRRCSIAGARRTWPVSAISPRRRPPRAAAGPWPPRRARPPPPGRSPGRRPGCPRRRHRRARTCRAGGRSTLQDGRHLLEAPEVESGHLPPARTLVGPDQRLDLDRERPPARERQRDRGAGMAFPEHSRPDGSIGESPAGPISNHAVSPSAPNRFLPPEHDPEPGPGVALEGQDDIDRVLERAWARRGRRPWSRVRTRRPSRPRSWPARRGRRRSRAPARPRPAAWSRPGRGASGSSPPRARPGARHGRPRGRPGGRGPARSDTASAATPSPAGAGGDLGARLLARREQAGDAPRRPSTRATGAGGSTCRCPVARPEGPPTPGPDPRRARGPDRGGPCRGVRVGCARVDQRDDRLGTPAGPGRRGGSLLDLAPGAAAGTSAGPLGGRWPHASHTKTAPLGIRRP